MSKKATIIFVMVIILLASTWFYFDYRALSSEQKAILKYYEGLVNKKVRRKWNTVINESGNSHFEGPIIFKRNGKALVKGRTGDVEIDYGHKSSTGEPTYPIDQLKLYATKGIYAQTT